MAGKHIIREVATGAVAGGTGLTVKHIAKENGASDTVAAVLGFTTSFATGYVLSMPKRNIKQTKQDPKIPVTGDDWENYFKSKYGEQYVTRKGTSGGKVNGIWDSVKTNTGKIIDTKPAANHSTVTKNPGTKGQPNSSVDILDSEGKFVTRRWYDSNGNALRDVDVTNHQRPKQHPEWPHEHNWTWIDGKPRRSK